MTTRITFPRAPLLGAALAAALALPRAAAGQTDSAKAPPPAPAPAVVAPPPALPPAPPTSPPTPTPARTQAGGGSAGGEGRPRQSTAGGTRREEPGAPRPRVAPPRPAGAGGAAATPSAPPPAETDTASGADTTAATTAPSDTGSGVVGATTGASSATGGGGGPSWLGGTAAAALALLLAGQGALIVLLGRTRREMRTFGARLNIREKYMNTHPADSSSPPAPPFAPDPIPAPGPRSPAPDPKSVPDPEPVPDGEPAPDLEPVPDPAPAPDLESVPDPAPAPDLESVPDPATMPDPEPAPDPEPVPAPEPVPDPEPVPGPMPVPPAWPGGSHALYARARARLAELQEERGEKDRARLSAAAARFERRKAWVLALHGVWENDVEFAYLDLLQKPGAGAVKDPYVMVYPVSEHDWKATRDELRRLATHIGALPEEGHPHWPTLLPRTVLRSSVDFDLRVQPPQGATPAAEFHARRLLATLLVNFKSLQRARTELGRLVQWVVEAAPDAEARPADVSPQALAILDAVCAAGTPAAQREAAVEAAVAELDAVDEGNFAAVRAAEGRAEALEQRYRAFLKVLFRVVDGADRARALHAGAMANGAADDAWLAGWGTILDEMDDLLVRRVLGARLEIEPIACEPGQALDTDLHNPLGAEPVQGVATDQVLRVESRGFTYADEGVRQVVKLVDVIAAVPAA